VRSSLLYDASQPFDSAFAARFDAALPVTDLARQLAELRPDVVYLHRYDDRAGLENVAGYGAPSVRFFHDHQLFCLREHKYTGFGRRTCSRRTGLSCYTCPGFVQRAPNRGLRLASLKSLHADQRVNRALSSWVVGSAYMAEHVADHGFPREHIHVLPLFTRMPAPAPAERERDLMVFAGQLVQGKGLDLLLEALTLAEHAVRLVVAGDGPQEASFRALADRLQLGDTVDFVGRVPTEQLSDLYRRAACVVVPSRSPETFGLVGLEALAHGTPVVAADVGGMREWLIPGETGLLFPSGEVAHLAKAVNDMLADPVRARSMGARGKALVAARFQPDAHADRLVHLFGSMVSHS
jgi:glycosyltransferase involved in cell wall biosynthesis